MLSCDINLRAGFQMTCCTSPSLTNYLFSRYTWMQDKPHLYTVYMNPGGK